MPRLVIILTTCTSFLIFSFTGNSFAAGQTAVERHAEELKALIAPVPDFVLDAGASQTLPIAADGTAKTTVTVTPQNSSDKTPVSVQWSISKPSDETAVQFGQASSAKTTVTFTKPGTYFLRANVTIGSWTDWTSLVIHVFDAKITGLAMDRFTPAPAPGIHPRIFFNPEELPALRDHFKTTVIGQELAKKLQVNSDLLRHGISGYDAKGPLSKLLDGSPLMSNAGYWASGSVRYQKLVAGDLNALGTVIPNMGGDTHRLSQSIAAEAFWCLIKEDHEGAKNVAAAITTWAKIVTPTIKPGDDWQWDGQNLGGHTYGKQEMGRIFDKVGREDLGLCYDFIYGDMTSEQRQIVRKMISTATAGKNGYGADQIHYVRVGNWVTFHTTSLMLLSLAIEGEEGYDPAIYKQGAEVFDDFYHYSIFPDGESFESLGKGGAHALIVMAMAKRGDWIIGSPHLENYFKRYLLNCYEPYGYHYIALSTLGDSNLPGGTALDATIAHYVYPHDSATALVYRNALGENYGGLFSLDDLLPMAMWGTDFQPPAGQPWDWDKSQPLTYVGRDQGLVITRSDWSKDATYLFFDCGTNIRDCGHYDPARNMFILSAMGRNWIADTGQEGNAGAHNVVLIDGKGGYKCPGKLVSYKDDASATSLCGDAKFAYDWDWSRSGATHGVVEPTTVNQIRYEPQPERWMETPLTFLYSVFSPFRLAREVGNPVERAYRTALLRRGPHPYVVVSDDIQKDDQSHKYEFLMRIPDDLEKQVTQKGNDLILADPTTDKRLLVRFITPAAITLEQRRVWIHQDRNQSKPILSVSCNAVKPDFRVLFYSYRDGENLPQTSWNQTSQRLQVSLDQKTDSIQFSAPSAQNTGASLLINP